MTVDPTGALAESPTLARVRAILLAVLAVGLAGTGVELLLLKHTEGVWQLVPVFLIGAALLTVGWVAVSRHRASLRLLQAVMWLFVLSGIAGLVLHFRGNILFEQESDPSIAGTALLHRALTGATPTLAPGTMIQLGLVGLVFLFRHPRLQPGKAT
jgi:FtsH-binding integral membrane protein